MFSTVGRYRRFDIRLDTVDDVPRWVSREWRGPEWRAKDAVERARHAYVKLDPQAQFFKNYGWLEKKIRLIFGLAELSR